MRFRTTIAVLCLIVTPVSCQRPWPAGVVARWDGGDADLGSIERHLGSALDATLSGEDLVRRYRSSAEELCTRDVLAGEHGSELDSRFASQDREFTRRQITVSMFVNNRIDRTIEVAPDEIEAFHTENPEYSHRPERRFVEHIFRRATGDAEEHSARDVLDDVKTRYLQGESFSTLAMEYSQSETAVNGGTLGMVIRGDLHETAEDVVFVLNVGEISEPTVVHGGLAVFVVTQIYPEKTFPLADVQNQIAYRLHQNKLRERLDAIAEEVEIPAGVFAVAEDELLETLESDDSNAVIYRDGTLVFSVDEWRSRITAGTAEAQRAQYTEFLRLQKVYFHAVAEGFFDEPGVQEAITERFERTLNDELINQVIQELLVDMADDDTQALTTWYDHNRERYQSPIELLVHQITVPQTTKKESPVEELRAIASHYGGGDLDQAGDAIEGATVSQARVGSAALDVYHPRVRSPLLALEPPACGPVYNIGGAFHLFCVEERKDPRQLSFDEARDQAVTDFVAANEQKLYAEIRAEILDDANFEFNEARVREVLHAPVPESE